MNVNKITKEGKVKENQWKKVQRLKFSNAYALLIGVGGYKHLPFSDLSETVTDAIAIAQILSDPDLCGYDASNVQLIVNEQATRTNIRSALKKIVKSTNPNSTVFIYFSGHGGRAMKNGVWQTYLCPRETDPYNLAHTAISGDEFNTLVASIPAQKILVIIDACHAGGAAEPKTSYTKIEWEPCLPDDYYEALSQGSGRVIIASSKECQKSYNRPQGDFGIFTWHLCEALRGKAAIRGDGLVHVLDVFHYVSECVQADNPKQTPILKVKNLDLNFSIALYQQWKRVSPASRSSPIAHIRKQIISAPLQGAKTLSEYLKEKQEWAAIRDEVDSKLSELKRTQKNIDLYGPDPAEKADKNRAIYYLLHLCSELEKADRKQHIVTEFSKESHLELSDENINVVEENEDDGEKTTVHPKKIKPPPIEKKKRKVIVETSITLGKVILRISIPLIVVIIAFVTYRVFIGLFNNKVPKVPEIKMVHIPAGNFLRGTSEAEIAKLVNDQHEMVTDETPQKEIYLDEFYISKYEITNEQYGKFLKDNPDHPKPDYWDVENYNDPDQPVVGVNWNDAVAFCNWLSQKTGENYRIPSEAQWEKAARGTDGRIFPWGYSGPDIKIVNFSQPYGNPKPVGYYPGGMNQDYKTMEMAGNVAEWCNDWYDESYYSIANKNNSEGPSSGQYKVVRGGSFKDNAFFLRCTARNGYPPDTKKETIGFRIVRIPDN